MRAIGLIFSFIFLAFSTITCKPSTDSNTPYYYTTDAEKQLKTRQEVCTAKSTGTTQFQFDNSSEHCLQTGSATQLSLAKDGCSHQRFSKWDETEQTCVLDQKLLKEWEEGNCKNKGWTFANGVCEAP